MPTLSGDAAARTAPRLSKSRYLAGLQCERQLWLRAHRPELATPPDPGQQAVFEMGHEVGRRAHALFPGGVLVDEPHDGHAAALARTRALLADRGVPAVFEGAFEHRGVRIRADVLERLAGGAFGLREVKASTSVHPVHLPDVAIQKWVLQGCGLAVPSAEVVHVDGGFVRGAGEMGAEDWRRFFVRADVTARVDAQLAELAPRVDGMHGVLGRAAEPEVEPDGHCRRPYLCPFWSHCTAGKPPEWIVVTRRLAGGRRVACLEAARSGRPYVAPELPRVLAGLEAPVWYLDFETIAPAIPILPGTRPFEAVAAQWSLHRLDTAGRIEHRAFLAPGPGDPRRSAARSLLGALRSDPAPVVVWSGYESQVLRALAGALPDLGIALADVRGRLVDLYDVVRRYVYHPAFRGSFSLKDVAPALVPGFGYGDLRGVADGASAASALLRLVAGELPPLDEASLREALLAYCERDTRALVEVHAALRKMSPA